MARKPSKSIFRPTFPGVAETKYVAPQSPPDQVVGFDPGLGVSVTRSGKSLDVRGKKSPTVSANTALDYAGGAAMLAPGMKFSQTNLGKAVLHGNLQGFKETAVPPHGGAGQINAGMAPFPVGSGGLASDLARVGAKAEKAYKPRTIGVNDLTAQLQKPRSRVAQAGLKAADKASVQLEKSDLAKKTPVVRLATASERAVKAAGRAQRIEKPRAAANMAQHLHALKKVKAGSAEDVANFWYAQLPKPARNAAGLRGVRDWQATHLGDLTSGAYAARLNKYEKTIRGKLHATSLGHATEEVPSGVIEPGVIVHAADQNNYGRVVSVSGDHANVHFINRAEGTEAKVDLPLSQLTSSGLRVKPGTPAAEVTGKDVFPLLKELERIKQLRTDLPQHELDTAASVSQLEKLIAKPPAENTAAIAAAHALGREHAQIFVEAGRLNPEKIEPRQNLLANELGVPTEGLAGSDLPAYVGHRLARPESGVAHAPSPGVGRVASPAGIGSENKLVIAQNGRVRQSLHVAAEDWQSAQTFKAATRARDDLGKAGTPFTGSNLTKNDMLVNPKAVTVPPSMKTPELAQFHGDYEDIANIRAEAQKIVDQFVADSPEQHQAMIDQALMDGMNLSDLRVVPRRLVERYYAQFRASGVRSKYARPYDALVDMVATSIVFARVGYIPKNAMQNLIMSVPHQGAFLLPNSVKAAQVMADPELRAFFRAEVHGTGPTGALSTEMSIKSVTGKITNIVSTGADDPFRISALVHELGAEHIINPYKPFLTEADRARLLRFFTNPANRAQLNDVRARAVEAMADFSRMTPDQSRVARRILIIPGWLMAGTRYPFHFAATHPIRSALLAYIALGEPGSPHKFNKSIDKYFHGTGYKQGIDIGGRRFRTNSLSPVSTPYDLAQSAVGTVRGTNGPYDSATQTLFGSVQPLAGAAIGIAKGEGIKKNLVRLAPGYSFVKGEISPKASDTYPEDASRLGRLKREVGVLPIKVNDTKPAGVSRRRKGGSRSIFGGGSSGSSGSRSIFR